VPGAPAAVDRGAWTTQIEARGARGGAGVRGAWGWGISLCAEGGARCGTRGWLGSLSCVACRTHDKDFSLLCVFSKTHDKAFFVALLNRAHNKSFSTIFVKVIKIFKQM
jgi:hypothetical protein